MNNEPEPNDAEELYKRGNSYYSQEKYKDAIDDFSKAIEKKPSFVEAYYKRGKSYDALKMYKEAISDYTKAIEKKPKFVKAYYARGKSYNALEMYEEAVADFSRAIELKPYFAEVYCNRGNSYDALEKYKDAIDDFSKAIKLKPNFAEAYCNRGNSYDTLEMYEKAIADFSKAIELKPFFAEAYCNRGNSYDALEMYKEAISDYSKAIKLKSDFVEAYYYRGNSYDTIEKYKEAISDYSKVINSKQDFAEVYYNRGNSYNTLEMYKEAISDYSKAIDSKKDFAAAYLSKGDVYFNQGQYRNAIKSYEGIINHCKEDSSYDKYKLTALFYIGIAFSQIKEYEECNNHLLTYLESDETISSTNKEFTFQIIGENYIHMNENKKGIEYLNLAQIDPIETLACYNDIEQMQDVTSSLIDKNPNCRFNRIIAPIKDNEELVNSYRQIYLSILKIIYSLLLKDDKEYSFAHYTTRKIASLLILDKSSFCLSSALTTNDPTEGEILMKYLNINTLEADPDINRSKDIHDFQAFIGCFSFNEKSLNQFRLYGKENSEEATGVSIVLNHNFFNQNMCLDILPEKQKRDIQECNGITIDHKYPIFRCLYIDPDKKDIVSLGHSDDNEINKKLEDIKKISGDINDMLSNLQNKDKDIIENLFLTLRYLVKHAAFKEEQECRMICIKDMDEDAKKEKEEREILFTSDYSRMHMNYQKIDKTCLEKVIFGPKAKGFEIFKKALKHEHIDCECEKSGLPFA